MQVIQYCTSEWNGFAMTFPMRAEGQKMLFFVIYPFCSLNHQLEEIKQKKKKKDWLASSLQKCITWVQNFPGGQHTYRNIHMWGSDHIEHCDLLSAQKLSSAILRNMWTVKETISFICSSFVLSSSGAISPLRLNSEPKQKGEQLRELHEPLCKMLSGLWAPQHSTMFSLWM